MSQQRDSGSFALLSFLYNFITASSPAAKSASFVDHTRVQMYQQIFFPFPRRFFCFISDKRHLTDKQRRFSARRYFFLESNPRFLGFITATSNLMEHSECWYYDKSNNTIYIKRARVRRCTEELKNSVARLVDRTVTGGGQKKLQKSAKKITGEPSRSTF